MERNGHDIMQVLFRHITAWTEEKHDAFLSE